MGEKDELEVVWKIANKSRVIRATFQSGGV